MSFLGVDVPVFQLILSPRTSTSEVSAECTNLSPLRVARCQPSLRAPGEQTQTGLDLNPKEWGGDLRDAF